MNTPATRAKVFITQIPHAKDPSTGVFIPKVNVAPAQEHGDLVVMLPPNAPYHATADLVANLANHLSAYDFESGDVLIAMGSPNVVAAACAYLGAKFGRFRLASWDRNLHRYLISTINVGREAN